MGAPQISPLYYPFTALVGQEELKLALLLNAVNPQITTPPICGEKGTVKSPLLSALSPGVLASVTILPE